MDPAVRYDSIGDNNERTERTEPPMDHVGKSSLGKVVFNFVNAVVGSGVLAIPYALHQAGLLAGVTIACVIGMMTEITIRRLVKTGKVEGVKNYEELMDKLFGFQGYVAISVLMFLYDFGAMLSYLIILGDVSVPVVTEFCSSVLGMDPKNGLLGDYWGLRRACIISLSVCLILPLCLNRDISGLEKASQFSVFITIIVILIVMFATITGDNCPLRDEDPSTCPDTSASWFTVLGKNPSAAFGILAFAFVAHDTAFMFHNSLRDNTPARWNRTTRLSLAFSVIICMAFAIPCFIAFREKIDQNLLKNFAADDYKIMFVRLLFMLTMSFTYPICFFICRHIVNELVYRYQRRNVHRLAGTPAGVSIQNVPFSRHLLLTLSLFGTSLAIACFVDQLGFVMSLTGNISAVSIAFILPPLCTLQSQKNHLTHCQCVTPFTTSSSMRRAQSGAADYANLTTEIDASVPLLDSASGSEGGVLPARLAHECPTCHLVLRWSYLTNGLIIAFGAFTLVFCTIQTVTSESASRHPQHK